MTAPNTICLYPQFAPSTGYSYGCRCSRCVQDKKQRQCRIKNTTRQSRYRKTPEGKAWAAAYWRSPQYKAYKRSLNAVYRQTPHGKAVSAANCAKRRAWKRKQSPKLNSTERQQVIAIYKRCQELTESTGIPHHVDHIIPLSKQGDHHPNNLQILTATENMKKGARTTVTQEFCPSP